MELNNNKLIDSVDSGVSLDMTTAPTKQKLTVCRFFITKLEAREGFAKSDYTIDLIIEKHGLYDLVSTVFEILHHENLTDDRLTSHLWGIDFDGLRYKYGWRDSRFLGDSIKDWNRPPNKTDIDHGERRIFASLANPLKDGQKGRFSGESAEFNVVVECASVETIEDDAIDIQIAHPFYREQTKSSLPSYPKFVKIETKVSGAVMNDWIDRDTMVRCDQLRLAWSDYFHSENDWALDDRTARYITSLLNPCHPVGNRKKRDMHS